jgi:hypothetical protein
MTLTIEKTFTCDYRECEGEPRKDIKVGRRGEQTYLVGDLPQASQWVKITFSGNGRSETLHFCCQDHCEKEVNLLTQQGLAAPEQQKVLGRG